MLLFDACVADAPLAASGDDQVCLDHAWQRQNWTHWLHCSEPELRLAVETVGTDPDNVRRFLRQMR